jgi:hypothetical protein
MANGRPCGTPTSRCVAMRDLLSGPTGWASTTHIFNTILSETCGRFGGLAFILALGLPRRFRVVRRVMKLGATLRTKGRNSDVQDVPTALRGGRQGRAAAAGEGGGVRWGRDGAENAARPLSAGVAPGALLFAEGRSEWKIPGCFRVEWSPGGTCTHWKAPPSTAHATCRLTPCSEHRHQRELPRLI